MDEGRRATRVGVRRPGSLSTLAVARTELLSSMGPSSPLTVCQALHTSPQGSTGPLSHAGGLSLEPHLAASQQ